MLSTAKGRQAEGLAAKYLNSLGYKIVERNWQTRFCEIDITARRHNTIILAEVRFRGSGSCGSAIETITAAKLRQMKRAAVWWRAKHDWAGDICLAVVAIDNKRIRLVYLNN